MRGIGIIIGAPPSVERSDWRPVPRADTGETYTDRGELGDYATNDGKPFAAPRDVRFFEGFAGDAADLRRGWCEPTITDDPAYDLANYKDRASEPGLPDIGPGNHEGLPEDYEFRNRNRRSEGFLTRPRIPRDRG